MIRALMLATALLFASPALAQTPTPTETQEPSPEALAAAREFYTAMVFDGGALDALAPVFAAYMTPQIRDMLVASPMYHGVDAEKRARIDAFVASLPELLIAEFGNEMERATDRIAPQFARIMTIEELQGATAFLRSSEMDPLWAQLMTEVGETNGNSDEGTLPDWNGTPEGRAFARTPAGLALIRAEPQIDAILNAESPAIFAAMNGRIELLVMTGLCDALQEQCPAQVRQSLGRT